MIIHAAIQGRFFEDFSKQENNQEGSGSLQEEIKKMTVTRDTDL